MSTELTLPQIITVTGAEYDEAGQTITKMPYCARLLSEATETAEAVWRIEQLKFAYAEEGNIGWAIGLEEVLHYLTLPLTTYYTLYHELILCISTRKDWIIAINEYLPSVTGLPYYTDKLYYHTVCVNVQNKRNPVACIAFNQVYEYYHKDGICVKGYDYVDLANSPEVTPIDAMSIIEHACSMHFNYVRDPQKWLYDNTKEMYKTAIDNGFAVIIDDNGAWYKFDSGLVIPASL